MDTSGIENVVLVVVDSMRADRVGCLGGDRDLTPTIDDLAADGVAFENAFACINATDPSITSMHTGRYPRETVLHHAHLVNDAEKRRVSACRRVPEILQDAGVSTLAAGRPMGRWHADGFDHYPAVDPETATKLRQRVSVGLYGLSPRVQRVAARAFHATAPLRDAIGGFLSTGGADPSDDHEAATDEATAADLLQAIDGSDGPFYGFLHTMDTHAWYEAEEDRIEAMLKRHDYPNRDLQTFFDEHSENTVVSTVLEPNATERDHEVGLARLYARYDATVARADDKVARLVGGLKERGVWDETALLVCSDHGESLTEHGIVFDHHGLYDQTVRVPLVVRLPGESGGQRVDSFVQLHDLFPTVLDCFGVEERPPHDGVSLFAHLDGTATPRAEVFVEEAHAQRRVGVRTDRWKYVEHRDDAAIAATPKQGDSLVCGYCKVLHVEPPELYDLASDPGETENVVEDHPDVAADLAERIADFEAARSPPTDVEDAEAVDYDDEEAVLERLEDLGYR